MDDSPREKEPFELRPRPKATRLNRLVLAVIGLAAIAVLWIGMWAVGRRPQAEEGDQSSRSIGRPLDVDRLQRATRRPPAAQPARRGTLPAPPPAPPSRARRGTVRTDPEALRAQRALDAAPVQPAFSNPTFYGATPRGSRSAEPGRSATPPGVASTEFQPRGFRPPGAAPRNFGPPGVAPAATLAEATAEEAGSVDRHAAFLDRARRSDPPEVRRTILEPPPYEYMLIEGSLLPGILTAGINSDLPGQVTALIRQNVYDTISARHLLVPTGARLIGAYDHRVAWGQRRVLVAWQRLVFPDGSSIDLAGMPGADLAGEAGVRDRVNNHFVRTFGSALLLSAFSAGAQLSQPQESSTLGQAASARQIVAAALGQELNRTATQILRRNLDIQPTLEIRPGYEFFIQLTADIAFEEPYAPSRR